MVYVVLSLLSIFSVPTFSMELEPELAVGEIYRSDYLPGRGKVFLMKYDDTKFEVLYDRNICSLRYDFEVCSDTRYPPKFYNLQMERIDGGGIKYHLIEDGRVQFNLIKKDGNLQISICEVRDETGMVYPSPYIDLYPMYPF